MMNTERDKVKKKVWEKPLVQAMSLKLTRNGEGIGEETISEMNTGS